MRSGAPKPTSVHGLESCTPVLPLKGEGTEAYTLPSGAGGSARSGWRTARDLVTGEGRSKSLETVGVIDRKGCQRPSQAN